MEVEEHIHVDIEYLRISTIKYVNSEDRLTCLHCSDSRFSILGTSFWVAALFTL